MRGWKQEFSQKPTPCLSRHQISNLWWRNHIDERHSIVHRKHCFQRQLCQIWWRNLLNFKGNTVFEENSAEYGGGIRVLNSTLKLTCNCSFSDNTAQQSGRGINLYGNSTLISMGYSTFRDNLARYFGGGINTDNSTLNFTGNTTFRGNSAEYGGGISVDKSTLNLTDSVASQKI